MSTVPPTSSGMVGNQDPEVKANANANPLRRFSLFLHTKMENSFLKLGVQINRHPFRFILLTLLIVALGLVGLVTSYEVEANPDKLYVPQDAEALTDQDYVEAAFGYTPRPVEIFSAVKGSNSAVDKDTLLAFLDMYDALNSNTISWGTPRNYSNLCIQPAEDGRCDSQSVLDLWSYNRTTLTNDPDVLATVNQANPVDVFGRPLNLERYIGGVTRDGSGNITSAKALHFLGYLENNKQDIDGAEKDDPIAFRWEVKLADTIVATNNNAYLRSFSSTNGFREEEFESATSADINLLTTGYLLLAAHGAFVMAKRNLVHSRSWLALPAVIAVGFAVLCAYGFGMAMGTKFSLVVNTLSFVLLGLGMDDAYVILDAIEQQSKKGTTTEERISKGLASAGVSITITSVTDLFAFLAGTFTVLPAVRAFCIFAAIGVMFDFLFQIIFFVPMVVLDHRRQESKRLDIFCCIKRPSAATHKVCSNQEYDPHNARSCTSRFMGKTLPKLILHPVGKVLVVVLTALFLGLAIWGVSEMKMDFQFEWFAPDDSIIKDAWEIRDDYFATDNRPAAVYTKQGDYFANQANMAALSSSLKTASFALSGSTRIWFDDYITFVENNATYSPYVAGGLVTNQTVFYESLAAFLTTNDGAVYDDHIVFTDSSKTAIAASQFDFLLARLSSAQEEIDAMDDCRDVATSQAGGLGGICYSFYFIFWEGNKVIQRETTRNVMIAAAAVFVASVLLLAKVHAAFMVLMMIALIDVNLLGFAHHWGVTYNSVSSINIILAVGLAVDYSAHIAHAFLVATGTGNERAAKALDHIGGSVLQGGFSTMLAVFVLLFAQSFIFRIFFKMFTLIVSFGLWHGIIFLPVVLSVIGPSSYEIVEKPEVTKTSVELV